MSTTHKATGSCLCGSVAIKAPAMSDSVGACHCGTCRRWSGGPMLAVDCGDTVEISGGEAVSVFASSDWAERGFCSRCGSHLFYRLRHNGQYIVPVALFGDDHPFVLDHEVFVDERPGYYGFAQQTTEMTGPEVFAKYAPPADGE